MSKGCGGLLVFDEGELEDARCLKEARDEAYWRGARDVLAEIYERLRRIRNESAGRIVTLLESEIKAGEWPKGGAV